MDQTRCITAFVTLFVVSVPLGVVALFIVLARRMDAGMFG